MLLCVNFHVKDVLVVCTACVKYSLSPLIPVTVEELGFYSQSLNYTITYFS